MFELIGPTLKAYYRHWPLVTILALYPFKKAQFVAKLHNIVVNYYKTNTNSNTHYSKNIRKINLKSFNTKPINSAMNKYMEQ